MNRWKVWNMNYGPVGKATRRMKRRSHMEQPWLAHASLAETRFFATHAEAITYADKQARRTT